MSNRNKTRLVYRDIPPEMTENLVSYSLTNYDSALSTISLDNLKQIDTQDTHYATLENNLWKLDGTFVGISGKSKLIWSTAISADTATGGMYELSSYPVLTREWSGYYTAPGVQLFFAEPDYCNHLNIKWYQDDTVVADEDFYPDNSNYFCRKVADLFNKIVITFYSMSAPNRYLKVLAVVDGRIVEFTNRDIDKLSVLEEINISNEALPFNTIDVIVKQKKTDIDYVFQDKQTVNYYYNDELYGTYFVQKSERTGKFAFSVTLQDYKGLLDTADFAGNVYINVSAQTIIDEIMLGEDIPYTVDSVTANTMLTGVIAPCKKREAIRQVLGACCSVCDDSRSDKLNIFKLPTTATQIPQNKLYVGKGTTKINDIITGVQLTVHNYTKSDELQEMHNSVLAVGQHRIAFSSPIDTTSTVQISGATLIETHPYYCIINVATAGKVILKAYKYEDNPTIKALNSAVIRTGTPINIKNVSNFTLVSDSNADTVLQYLMDYYDNNSTFTIKAWLTGQKVGDKIITTSDWGATNTGYIEKLSYRSRVKTIGEVTQTIDG